MGTKLTELDEYWSPGLSLVIRGREYTVPLPSAELGLWCQRIAQAAGQIDGASTEAEMRDAVDAIQNLPPLDGQDLTLAQRALGEVYDQLVADGVPYPYIEFAGQTAYVWIVGGEDAAERYWTSGGRPEALRPAGSRAQRRATAKTGGKTGTAAGSATKPRASTSGTSTPRKSGGSGSKRGTAKPTRGQTSSPDGTS